ncbi:MAG: helix-turn-helix transcriptional regulator [Deltaproteobacteria bacterium]|nr:MAG: helix-turn-helix transcriptional regulator [Deltaproteobacteria bacterium]
MTTNNIANKTKSSLSEPVEEIIDVPRPVVGLARDYPSGHIIPYHQHSRSQLVYASLGVMTVHTEEGIWVVPPLRAVWVPAFTEHQIHVSGRLAMRTLYIQPDILSNLPRKCFVVSVSPLLRELILYVVTLPPLYPLNGPEERIMTVILDQIQSLSIAPLDLPIPKDIRLKKIFQTLTGDPSDNRTLEEWGKTVGATSRTLTRLFRSETGMSFRQWRQQFRILEALRRLGRDESVTEVALDLGYDSPSAFIAMFRKALGQTPGQYFKGEVL